MKNRKSFFRIFLSFLVVVSLIGFWFFWKPDVISTNNAYVEADTAQIHALVGGEVKAVYVIDTQAVKKGDPLIKIDDIDAKLMLNEFEALLSSATLDLQRAESELERRKNLKKTGYVSAEKFADVRTKALKAKAKVDVLKAQYQKAKINFERTIIKAPVDVVVVKRQVQLGQHLQPGSFLMSVVPVMDVYVNANFKEVHLEKVKIGQPVMVESDFYGSSVQYSGKVIGIGAGTGSSLALIPTQNATGNWIKIVQRLPVRICLNKQQIEEHPLRVGLSMKVCIDTSKDTDNID